jgi:AcrR family transcriptional regulator
MPRGVAIPELRQQLFDAAARLLAGAGPTSLTSRAITTEAGCAKGVLHNHFTDLDGFLAEFVLDRFQRAVDEIAELKAEAGQGSVRVNLIRSVASLFDSPVLAVHGLLLLRPSLVARLREVHQTSGSPDGHALPGLGAVADVFSAYLDEEARLGRVRPEADTRAASLALVATVQHLLTAGHVDSAHARAAVTRVLDVLLVGIIPRSESHQEPP